MIDRRLFFLCTLINMQIPAIKIATKIAIATTTGIKTPKTTKKNKKTINYAQPEDMYNIHLLNVSLLHLPLANCFH